METIFIKKLTSKNNPDWVGYALCIEFELEDGSTYEHNCGLLNPRDLMFFKKCVGLPVHE